METKSQPRYDGVFHPDPRTFARLLYHELTRLGILKRTIVQSFDVRTLQAMREIDSTVTLAFLAGRDEGLIKHLSQLGFYPDIYSPDYSFVTKQLVESCHEKGIKIIPWTVNDPVKMKHLKKLGVDGLITDYPDRAAFLNKP
jgi:glycerophosphoryl diester phosphodiesterase